MSSPQQSKQIFGGAEGCRCCNRTETNLEQSEFFGLFLILDILRPAYYVRGSNRCLTLIIILIILSYMTAKSEAKDGLSSTPDLNFRPFFNYLVTVMFDIFHL